MLLAVIIAITLIAFYTAMIVGLALPKPEVQVRSLNYPDTLVYRGGESWAIKEDWDENV